MFNIFNQMKTQVKGEHFSYYWIDLEKAINMSWHPTKTLLLPL